MLLIIEFIVLKQALDKVHLVSIWSSARADFLFSESHSDLIYIPVLAWLDVQLFAAFSPLTEKEPGAVFC